MPHDMGSSGYTIGLVGAAVGALVGALVYGAVRHLGHVGQVPSKYQAKVLSPEHLLSSQYPQAVRPILSLDGPHKLHPTRGL